MFIVLTPFIENKADYRLTDLERNRANDRKNLAEPYWYSDLNPRMVGFMYGGRAENRPDILDIVNLDSLLEYFDENYRFDTLVHIPRDIYLDVDEIEQVISNKLFEDFPLLSDNQLEEPFIRQKNRFYKIPVELIDANNQKSRLIRAPAIQFEDDNQCQEINNFLSNRPQSKAELGGEFLPIAIGGWCGVAEALKCLGLRGEAYPFDYIKSDFRPIVDLLDLDKPSREQIESILFGEHPENQMEFVHHKTENDAVRETLVARTHRFIERVSESEQPVWFIRAARNDIALIREIQQARRLLDISEQKFNRKTDKLLLIANYTDLPTGRMSYVMGGQIVIWNAMGTNGWKVPNNWHLATNLVKIIKHELFSADKNGEPHFRRVPDYRKIPTDESALEIPTSESPEPESSAEISEPDKTSKVIVHLSNQAPLEFRCDDKSQALNTLFQAIYENETHPGKQGSLVHLRVEEDGKHNDVVLRSSQICRIEVSPSLNPDTPRNLNRKPLTILARCKRKTRHILGKLRR